MTPRDTTTRRKGWTTLSLRSGVLLLALLILPSLAASGEVRGRYATVHYDEPRLLHDFNGRISLGASAIAFLGRRAILTGEDEVPAKVDAVFEQVETVLEMFPDRLHVRIVLLADRETVAQVFSGKLGRNGDPVACYSPAEKTIYLSVDDADVKVLAHEVGHAVVDLYFDVRPPDKIHELLAQFAEKHFRP